LFALLTEPRPGRNDWSPEPLQLAPPSSAPDAQRAEPCSPLVGVDDL
jgi:hypothetical protein